MNDTLTQKHDNFQTGLPGWAFLLGTWLLLMGLIRLINTLVIQRMIRTLANDIGFPETADLGLTFYIAVTLATLIAVNGVLILCRINRWRIVTIAIFVLVLIESIWLSGSTMHSFSQRHSSANWILLSIPLLPLLLEPGIILFFAARFRRLANPLVTLLACFLMFEGINSLIKAGMFALKMSTSQEPINFSWYSILVWFTTYLVHPLGLIIASLVIYYRPIRILPISGFFRNLAWIVVIFGITPFIAAYRMAEASDTSSIPLMSQNSVRISEYIFPLIMTILIARYHLAEALGEEMDDEFVDEDDYEDDDDFDYEDEEEDN